ncbi:signal transduction histidine kinase with CheB and CheR activity [Rhodopirellula maiorica SM1]|uniref:Signal transduction histidine kinase with CheB and CheR activity n=1 Tax=Rhodopirellula maiorica SM1 TaxID=1265738 RepID=M5RDE8_9BACT|nr:chemotaxis protein CheB [Rhodopirellula maiorica]EMI17405.1 signal transduction histidine kinase with CheB and CheR activity [Rhodopirellula maiorica SM1]
MGIGASAGGLEALEAFFQEMPASSGMAFVVIQHLSPDFKSHMGELISRKTGIPVLEVEDGVRVSPNAIYLLPAKMEMEITGGRLRLTKRNPDRSFSHPIDKFFCSLAKDQQANSIAVVLSGTGSDGSRGIRDIHEAGGLVVSQDQASAKFDGMPISAQETGLVNLVLPPNGMAKALMRYVQGDITRDDLSEDQHPSESLAGIDRIFQLLNQSFGIDFSQYKSSTVGRRLQRRFDMLRIRSFEDYVSYIENHPNEQSDLYRDLLVGVTQFFRDPDAYATLAQKVIPKLFDANSETKMVRTWVAGCASGEEAYSIAILLDEERRKRDAKYDIKIFATDAHPSSIQTAARGIYPADALADLSHDRLTRYFRRDHERYQVTPQLRQMIVFAPHNVISDAPFTQMDLVTCRNLLIYLQAPAQAKALSLFHFALKSGGTLFLGPSESPGELSDEFDVLNTHWRIYCKRRDLRMPPGTELPLNPRSEKFSSISLVPTTRQSNRVDAKLISIYDALLNQKMGCSILIEPNGQILHVFGGAEKYLQYASGRPSSHILDAIVPRVKSSLSVALHHTAKKQGIVKFKVASLQSQPEAAELDIAVEPIGKQNDGTGTFLISFTEQTSSLATYWHNNVAEHVASSTRDSDGDRVTILESELQQSQENLQATVEEMETSNEELQAANEELVASNEELQSTNEELHSVNEELYTVNAEHQRRVVELAEANADMDNLLATTRVGVVFLDRDFCLRRYTPQIAEILRIQEHDIGRSIEDFTHRLRYDNLLESLQNVLQSEQEFETKVFDSGGHALLLRAVPYLSDGEIKGVVLTLIDIASLSAAEAQLERFKFMTETASDLVFLADQKGRFRYVNPSMCETLRWDREELENKSLMEVQCELAEENYQKLFADAAKEQLKPFQSDWKRSDGSLLPMEISVASLQIDDDRFLCANARDITDRRATELEMRLQHLAIESTLNGIVITDATAEDNPITYANPGFLSLTGYERDEVTGINCRFLQGDDSDSETLAKLREAIAAGESCHVTLRNYRKDGTPFWNDLQITPVFDERDRLVNFVGVQNDITDRMKVQEALQLANQEAKAASEAKSSFMANMSHELRTPMTAMLGFADMLSEELSDDPLLEKVSTIKRNGEYLLALLNDILDLSKIESGKMEIHPQTLSVRKLLGEVQELMQVRASEEGIPLTFDWNPDSPSEITADAIRVRQVLVNLISNALKFTDEGNVRVAIGMNQETNPPTLVIAVHDTGIGIHESHLTELFTPFSHTGAARRRRYGGTGLGLSISKRLAEEMGGEITVKSELGVGSCFTFTLPLTPDQVLNRRTLASDEEPAREPIETKRALFPKFSARVLLADDRRDIWRIGKYFLEKCGADVTVVEDGLQAVEETQRAQKEQRPFDLILMDMQMPVMTGQEAVAEIRELGFKTPIIALTADAMEGEREACIAMGCDDYFPKPIDGVKLMNLVAFYLSETR